MTRTTRLKCAKCSAHTRNRWEKRAIWSDIALFFSTVEYGKSGEIPRKKGNMVWYGRNHTKDKRASKIRVFILPLKCLIWIIIKFIVHVILVVCIKPIMEVNLTILVYCSCVLIIHCPLFQYLTFHYNVSRYVLHFSKFEIQSSCSHFGFTCLHLSNKI